MLISRGQRIAGRDAVEVRETMRRLLYVAYSTRALAAELDISDALAADHVAALQRDGFIAAVEHPVQSVTVEADDNEDPAPTLWMATIAGSALAKARIGKPITRAKAQRLLDEVVVRVRQANDDGSWLHWVTAVLLYGSFSRNGEDPVGDVDVAVRLEPRYEHQEYLRRQDALIARDGVRPRNIADEVTYAQRKLLRHLRGRSGRVDLCAVSPQEPLPPGAPPTVIYEFAPAAASPTLAAGRGRAVET